MSNPNPTSGFQKGVSGNPGGKPKDRITQEEFRKIFDRVAHTPAKELKAMEGNSISAVLTAIMMRGMKTGEHQGLAWMLDRAIGKVPEVTLTANLHEDAVLSQPREKLYEFVKTAA